ncbi:MAG: hypothetical protein M3131_06475 [Actinomycetota bacterium]|nr:hypothetical protein [Actinomycetota bacterium]
MSSRSIFLASTAALALVLAAVSLAWACTAPSFGVPATFTLSSSEGPAGSNVTAEGRGWEAANRVVIRWDSKDGPVLAEPAGPDFSQPIKIPSTATPGDHVVVATAPGRAPMTAALFVTRTAESPAGQPGPTRRPAPPATEGTSGASGAPGKRARAVATCKRRYGSKGAKTASKRRRLARKRAACIQRAKKRFPLSPASSFTSPLSPSLL